MTSSRVLALILTSSFLTLAGCSRRTVVVQAEVVAEADKRAAAEKPAANAFRFPSDHGGQLLGQLLTPPAQMPDRIAARGSLPLPPPASVTHPEVAPQIVALPPLPRVAVVPSPLKLWPPSLREEAPLSGYQQEPKRPVEPRLPAGARVQLPSSNVEEPVPLPILAHPSVDRAPLEDPTTEDSLQAVLAETPPLRATPVPFTPQGLPDPFVNAATVRLKTPPPEEGTPISASPQVPR